MHEGLKSWHLILYFPGFRFLASGTRYLKPEEFVIASPCKGRGNPCIPFETAWIATKPMAPRNDEEGPAKSSRMGIQKNPLS
jgi:hypothetical protein